MFNTLASKETIQKTMRALEQNGIRAFFAENSEAAKKKFLELIPEGSDVMSMTSVTLETISLNKEINESGKFNSVRKKLMAMDQKTEGGEMRKIGAAPDWAIGSVHAITEDGQIMVASASGSQLPAYAYGAGNVVWVAGAHKIVKNLEEGFKRIYEHSLPLENERAKKVYGMGSSVNKILIVNKESQAGRLNLILVNEVLGF